MRFPPSLWLVAMFSGLAIGRVSNGAMPATDRPPEDPIVDLPTLTVEDSKVLPPLEAWRYARVDGFEVLSNASDRAASRLLNDFIKLC